MFRILLSKSKLVLFGSTVPVAMTTTPTTSSIKHSASDGMETSKASETYVIVQVESGWDRIRKIFKSTEYEAISPELQTIFLETTSVAFIGAVIGTLKFTRDAYVKFMETFHPSQFGSHLDAKALLSEKITRSLVRGSLMWGWRTGAVTLCWILVTRFVAAYRDEIGWHDNIAGGLTAGALGGYLCRDLTELRIDKSVQRGRFFGGPLSVQSGAAMGCLFGVLVGAYHEFTGKHERKISKSQYWEKYWEERRRQMRIKDPNYRRDD